MGTAFPSIRPIKDAVPTHVNGRTNALNARTTPRRIPFSGADPSVIAPEQMLDPKDMIIKDLNTDLPTQINPERFYELMDGYPDEDERRWVYEGFKFGFRIMSGTKPQNTEPKNHFSVRKNPEIAQNLIDEELKAGRISGPHDKKPFENFHISPIKTVPKKDPNKHRKILNLSFPYDDTSINSGITEQNSSIQYASIQDCIDIIQEMGQGCYLVKSDLKSAFRSIPVHPDDYPLLGFKFKGKYYFDRCLSQGASSSCQIFERIATALEWILKNKFGVKYCIHILDDFLMFSFSTISGRHYLQQWRALCTYLGWVIAEEKTEGPVKSLVFSGILVDTQSMVAFG